MDLLFDCQLSANPTYLFDYIFQDFDVHGIAPRAVSTKDEFSQSRQQGVKRAAGDIHHDVIPGQSALQSLIVPAHSTIGAQLLKALGWKEGEGLGPKVMKYGPRQGLFKTFNSYQYFCLFWHA